MHYVLTIVSCVLLPVTVLSPFHHDEGLAFSFYVNSSVFLIPGFGVGQNTTLISSWKLHGPRALGGVWLGHWTYYQKVVSSTRHVINTIIGDRL